MGATSSTESRAEADSKLVNESLHDGVFHIELNRPEAGNTANKAFADQLRTTVLNASSTSGVRALLVSAAGRNFMAGGDLSVLRGDHNATLELVRTVNDTIVALSECTVPIVCAVQGMVAGGGLGLALSSDILIAEEGARFTVGSPAIGLSPDAGTSWQLARWVGQRKALEMSLLCTMVDVQDALACGLINEIAPKGSLMEVARSRATQLASGASLALRHTRQLLRAAAGNTLVAQIAQEGEAFAQCMQSPDFSEGLAAMMEKRKPRFS